jgi:hypothetical protein
MAVSTNQPLLGYPTDIGNKHLSIFDHVGPKSYANIGTSSGAGDVINASDIGWGGFDRLSPIFGGYSLSGTYIVKMFTGHTTTTPTITQGNQTTRTVQWFTTSAAFGAISTEVTNATDLSAEVIRFEAIGV